MKAAVFYGPGQVRVEDVPVPVAGPGEVLLGSLLAGVCRTDAHIVAGHFPVAGPRVLGHELAGVVEAAGPGVDPDWVGRACGVEPAWFCGECPACRRGLPELCADFHCLGNTHEGGFAEKTVVPAGQLRPLDGLTPEAAVWLEPLACVVHALELAGGGPLLVTGAGVLGRLALLAARALGIGPLAAVDPNPEKIQKALACGAGWALPRSGPAGEVSAGLSAWAPGGPAAILETSGAAAALERALDWAGPGGRIVLFGVSDPAGRVSLPPSLLFQKELTLTAAAGMTPASFRQAESLLRSGRVDPAPLAAGVIPLERLPALLLGQESWPDGKIFVRARAE